MASNLHIGWNRKDKKAKIELPVNALKRHFAALGSSGSGKTVLVKAVMEECIRAGIPLIMVDLQGDLASLAMMGDKKTVESKGTPGAYHDEIAAKAKVAIFTPASSKGIPISMNPLKAPPTNMATEDFIQAVDSVAETVANILKYGTEKGKGADVKNYLYLLFEEIWKSEQEVKTFGELAEYIINDSSILNESSQAMLNEKDKAELAKNVKGMTIGADSLLFNLGLPLDIDTMMTWAPEGTVPVNVIYLNTLRSQQDKVNFIADIANQLYSWMLRHPSNDLQLVFILDELAGLVPPIRNPPSKKSIQLLLKQARKYGVSLLLATQNISDVDYKSLGQVSTWALGKLIARQDIDKVKDIIQAISPAETDDILSILPKQTVGQFMLLNPDVYDSVQRVQARWLVTDHTTLDDRKVEALMDKNNIRPYFDMEAKEKAEEDEEPPVETSEEIFVDPDEPEEVQLQLSDSSDVLEELDRQPLALSAEELADITNENQGNVSKELDKLVKSKKLLVEEFNGVKIYWSKKHKMDPKNNIVGPLFRFHLSKPRGVVEKVMKANIPKTLGIRSLYDILNDQTELFYIPMWRINVIRTETEGLFKKKSKEVKRNFYINGMDGSLLVYDEKEESMLMKTSGIEEPDEVQTLPASFKPDPEVLEGLRDADLKPTLNREDAIDKVKQLIGARVNRRIVPSLCWLPVWQFMLKEKDLNTLDQKWIDGVTGSLLQDNPLK
ncbi:MAG: ATP-binding protein [Candidatus Kariarchaeaceae archaeon]|jgi:hypothetical protein